jgi:hypothetical protein
LNGIIFIEIGKFAQSRLGPQGWAKAIQAAGIPSRVYYRVAEYPDEEAFALVSALSAALHEPVPAVLEGLGEFIVPDLVRMSRYWVKPQWKTLDLIEHTEETIHETLRQEGSQTNPPRLRTRRTGAREVVVSYDSPRRMCFLAKGIIAGLAKHYGESVTLTEPSCMHRGDASCELIIALK